MKEDLFRRTLVLAIVILFIGSSGMLTITSCNDGNRAIDSIKTAEMSVTKTSDVAECYSNNVMSSPVVTNTNDGALYDVYLDNTTVGTPHYIKTLYLAERIYGDDTVPVTYQRSRYDDSDAEVVVGIVSPPSSGPTGSYPVTVSITAFTVNVDGIIRPQEQWMEHDNSPDTSGTPIVRFYVACDEDYTYVAFENDAGDLYNTKIDLFIDENGNGVWDGLPIDDRFIIYYGNQKVKDCNGNDVEGSLVGWNNGYRVEIRMPKANWSDCEDWAFDISYSGTLGRNPSWGDESAPMMPTSFLIHPCECDVCLKALVDIYKIIPGDLVTLYETDFEDPVNASNEWIAYSVDSESDTWTLSENRSHSSSHSYHCTGYSQYMGNAHDILEMRNPLCLSGVNNVTLTFWSWCKGEGYYVNGSYLIVDYGDVEISNDGGTNWISLSNLGLSQLYYDNDWMETKITLESSQNYSGIPGEELLTDQVKFRFVWYSSPQFQYEGWYIDDIRIDIGEKPSFALVWETMGVPCTPFGSTITYSFPLNWTVKEEGKYLVEVLAQEWAPYIGVTYSSKIVSIGQPPTVEITSPREGETVSGTIIIQGTASDPDGDETLERVEVKIDEGSWEIATGTTSWSYRWDTTMVDDGQHTIYARSYDGEVHSEEDFVSVEVKNVQTVKILPVPYIHQCYDTPDDFKGHWACAPTSAVMVLAYYKRIDGNYASHVCEPYYYNGKLVFTKSHTEPYSRDNPCGEITGKGAWGYIWKDSKQPDCISCGVHANLQKYLEFHDLKVNFYSHLSEDMARRLVKGEINNGRPLIARTLMGGKYPHYVVIVGYEENLQGDFLYKVNDPFGKYPYGSNLCMGNVAEQPVTYSYSDMRLDNWKTYRGLMTISPKSVDTVGHTVVKTFSPVNLHAMDEYGRHVGINETGDIEIQIPEAEYSGPDAHPQWIAIYNNSSNVTFYAVGIETGTFDMVWERIKHEIETIHFIDIPTTESSRAYLYSTNPHTLEVDGNGDGNIDTIFKAPIATFTYYPQITCVNRTVFFNASGSYDPDGDIVLYKWDFGDNTTSLEPTAIHAYNRSEIYSVTLTISDDDGFTSTIQKNIIVLSKDTTPPTIKITRPKNALYIKNNEITSFPVPVIVGSIQICFQTLDNETGLNRLEIYIDDELEAIFTTIPQSWTWDETAFGRHIIKAIAYDNCENEASDEITVWKFF